MLMQRGCFKYVVQELIGTNPNGYFLVIFSGKGEAVSNSRTNSLYIDLNGRRTPCENAMFTYIKARKHIALRVITQQNGRTAWIEEQWRGNRGHLNSVFVR